MALLEGSPFKLCGRIALNHTPKSAGIVNLYTREYFQLVRDRLTDNGIASYWLPGYQLSESDSKAIIRGFCDAFSDCSMWNGGGAEWILIGSRGPWRAPAYADFARQWNDPVARTQLVRLAIETPEQLGAMFIADAAALNRLTAAPLTDDHPLRLSTAIAGGNLPEYRKILADAPPSPARSAQRIIDERFIDPNARIDPRTLLAMLTQTQYRILPRIYLRSDMWLEQIARDAVARGSSNPELLYIVGVGELSDRRYAEAAKMFGRAEAAGLRDAALYAGLASRLAGEQNH